MKPSKPRSAARHLIWPSAAILLGMSFVPLCMLVFFSFADGNVSTLNGVAGYTVRNIVEAEKHRVAPNCANCTMRCGNTDNYDLARLWNAPAEVRTLKLELLAALFALAQRRSTERIADEIRNDLFVLAEDWDTTLLSLIVPRAQELCRG